jgi:hypothetical protein
MQKVSFSARAIYTRGRICYTLNCDKHLISRTREFNNNNKKTTTTTTITTFRMQERKERSFLNISDAWIY